MTMMGTNFLSRSKALARPAMLVAAAMAGLAASGPANAMAQLTLSYTAPTGIVTSTETIEIWGTLTNVGSETFEISGGQFLQGLTAQDFVDASGGLIQLADIATIGGYSFFSCSDTFSGGCGSSPYTHFGSGGPFNLLLNPGDSAQVLLGEFGPTPGPVPAGGYIAYNMGLGAYAYDAKGDGIWSINYGEACAREVEACAFTRTVLRAPGGAVPEPASWAMLVGGFGLLGAAMRRRQIVTLSIARA